MKSIITITENAYLKLRNIAIKNNTKSILFYIKSGGCNGFEYKFKPISAIQDSTNVFKKRDITIEVCNKSLLYILGTEIDWKEDMMGSCFKFNNPSSKISCGCGTSFSV